MENHSFDQIIGSSAAPYINQLAGQHGQATSFYAEAHPSLPNYIAMTSGSTQGIADDADPASHPLDVPSLFSLLPGGASRSLQESMPTGCLRSDAGDYAVRHNPQAYYVNLGEDCARYDIPLSDPPDPSARFTLVTPNLMHDMHTGAVAAGDSWLSEFVPKVLASSQYAGGRAAVFLTWGEDDLLGANHIPTLVVTPSVTPGARVTTGSTITRCSAPPRRCSVSSRCSGRPRERRTCAPRSASEGPSARGSGAPRPRGDERRQTRRGRGISNLCSRSPSAAHVGANPDHRVHRVGGRSLRDCPGHSPPSHSA